MRAIISDNSGKLVLRFRILGRYFAEQTKFADSPRHRGFLQDLLITIKSEIKCGTFDYVTYFPHSKNALVINALKSKFLSPQGRRLPTVKQFYMHQYQQPRPKLPQKMMLPIMVCLGELPVDQVTGKHLFKLVEVLKTIAGLSKPQFVHTIKLALSIVDQAALVYVFARPFRLVSNITESTGALTSADKPLNRLDVLHITDFVPIKYHDIFLLQLYTGLSSMELVELEWAQYSPGLGLFTLPDRTVYTAPCARQLLFKLMKKSGNSRYVFCDQYGKKQKLNHIWLRNECWPKACHDAGMGELSIYALRRASVLYLCESGLSVEQISQQTGLLHRPTIDSILSQHTLLQ